MQTQRLFWLKALGLSGIVLVGVYFFTRPAIDVETSQQPVQTTDNKSIESTTANNNMDARDITTTESKAEESTDTFTSTPELDERIATIKQRRPNLDFSPQDVAAAVSRTTSWAPTDEVPRELPLEQEEFSDGRQFIDLDTLKIETLVPGDQVNVRVDQNGKDYKVTIDKVEKHDYNSISWHGHIQGDDGQKYSVSFTRGEQLTVGGLDTPDGHYVLQAHGNKGWVASSQLLFKADTSVSDAIHPADVDPNYAKNQDRHSHNH
ncbi:MAG: hypothetical protein AAGC78_02200 [Cellvibrio sp.]|uniref:hypothetical protein n=1 Tax=Cellvibrio sp. TaxID=1965322 RepID=UPI0031AB3EA6